MNVQYILFFILINAIIGKDLTAQNSSDFYVGTYTKDDSKGIYKYTLENDGTLQFKGLVAKSDNPSFLAKTPNNKYIIAVNEINSENDLGTVESYFIQKDSLQFINRTSSGGAHPCFVTTNKNGFVLVANYTSGNVGLLKVDKKGKLSHLLDVQKHKGKGISERQESPHAHSAWFNPINNHIISVDLGTNELWFSQLDTLHGKLIPSNPNKLNMSSGAGPRHLVFHPNAKWIYVLNELNGTITLVQKTNDENYVKKGSFSTLPRDYKKPNTCADIHISNDGKYVYASNRGHNSIAMYKVNLTDGSLNLIGHESTRGEGPRNFSLSPDGKYLLVANQLTNNIVSFKRNKATGLLEYVQEIKAPTPVCILF